MEKENVDPDYLFYERDKSHNSSFYKKTPGVCTNTREELQAILRNTDSVSTQEVYSGDNVKTCNKTEKPELGRCAGFISQDVQGVCATAGLPNTFTTPIEGTDLLGLDYGRLTTILWSVCKRQQAALAALKARLQAIEVAMENA